MKNIHREIVVESSLETLFAAISSEQGFKSWWTTEAKVNSKLEGEADFSFGSGAFGVLMKFSILGDSHVKLEYISDKKMSYWKDSFLEFRITSAGPKKSKLNFVHGNISGEGPEVDQADGIWDHLIKKSLKEYVEKGNGSPVVFE